MNIDNYKRQAKILKKKFFNDIPLMQIQHMVAVQNGFKCWKDLKDFCDNNEDKERRKNEFLD